MSKIKVPADSESEEDPAFGAGKVFFFLCVLTWMKEASITRALIPFMRAPTS